MNRELNLLTGSDVVQQHRRITKELPEIGVKLYEPTGSWIEGNKLETALEERFNLIKEPRIERDSCLSIAKWDPEKKKVIVLKKKGKEWETYGHHDSKDNLDYLHPEEALFLIESNSLTLMHGDVEVSVEICYSLLLGTETGCSYEHYRVFSHLSRLGYKLIRHKKPDKSSKTVESISTNATTTRNVPLNKSREETGQSTPSRDIGDNVSDEVVMIDDSSSDSSSNDDDEEDDDVVIIDVIKAPKNKEIIDLDDNSRDSDIVMLDSPELIELPLEDWSYVHRDRFLYCDDDNDSQMTRYLNPFLMSKPEYEICNEIPNIKGQRAWLYRPDDLFLPPGIWPFHFKYLIDLDAKNDNFRGRGGFRGRPRGRGWYLQRQVSQMKSYTISLMNMVTKLVGDRGMDMIPPPTSLFQGSNRFHRGNFRQRGPTQTWGRISFNKSTRGSFITSDTIELSDDEEPSTSNRSIKHENEDEEDIKPNKKIKFETDICSIDSDNLIKTEPMDVKVEKNVKTESTNFADKNSEISSITPIASVKTEVQGKKHCEGSCKEPASSGSKPASPSTSVSNCQNKESTTPQSTVESLAPENILNESSSSKTNLNTSYTLENNPNDGSNSEINPNDLSNAENNSYNDSNSDNKPNDASSFKVNPYDTFNLEKCPQVASNSEVIQNDPSNPIINPNGASNPKSNLNDASNPSDASNPKINLNDAFNNPKDASNPKSNLNDVFNNPKDASNPKSNLNVASNPKINPNNDSNPKSNLNDESNPKNDSNDSTTLVSILDSESNIDSASSSKNYDNKEDGDIVSGKGNDNEIKNIENIAETTKANSEENKIDDTSSISESHDDKICGTPSATSHISRPDTPEVISVDDDSLSRDINHECCNQTNSDDCTLIESTDKDDCLDKNQDTNVPSSNVSICISDDVNQMEFETSDDSKKEDNSTECQQKTNECNRTNITNSESIETHCIDEQSNDNIETMSIDDDSDIVVDKISDNESSLNELESSTVTNSCDGKTFSWKQLKESDKKVSINVQKCGSTNEDQRLSDDNEEDIDFGTPLICPEDCISMDNVLKRLQIFGEYKSQGLPQDSEEVKVVYDVYLPNTPYYRNLPPDPDFRLIILRFEDSYPNADQMIHLNGIYNDKKNFLFAIVLKESIAYYLYNKVNLPVYNEM